MMRLALRWVLVWMWLAPAGAAHAASPAAEQPETFTLENGLEVIVIPNHRVPAVSHMLWYRVGAADDPPGKSGLAHYHEHLMYAGTKTLKAGDYSKTISVRGGQENAFTGHDATSYYVSIAKEHLPLAMKLEAERMVGLNFDEPEAMKEKNVILEERRQRVENSPDALLEEQKNAALFRAHPYHVPVIGWMHEMEGLSAADVQAFHARYYHPNNAILIVSGDVTAAEVKPLAQQYYGAIARGDVPARRWAQEPPQNAVRRVSLAHENVQAPVWTRDYAVVSIGQAPEAQDKAMALYAAAQLLGGGRTSLLYQELVVKRRIAASVDASYNGLSIGPAQFSLRVVPAEGVKLATVEAAVDELVAKFLAQAPQEKDLARAKTLMKAETIFARDGLSGVANIMGWVRMCGLSVADYEAWPQRVQAVTGQQVLEAARGALIPQASVTGELLPATPAKEAK